MSKATKAKMAAAISDLQKAYDKIESCRADEERAYNSIPESVQKAPAGQRLAAEIKCLEAVLADLYEMIDTAGDAFGE